MGLLATRRSLLQLPTVATGVHLAHHGMMILLTLLIGGGALALFGAPSGPVSVLARFFQELLIRARAIIWRR
ncbi:hypothetical protein KCP69_00570 [Salmonella enterica subsp. enterica]|nr:hypothetical protein KCP69_00570 [Salmonella enterica subsp. enterica]